MFKKEYNNSIIRYTVGEGKIYSSYLYNHDKFSQEFLEAKFDGIEVTRLEYCHDCNGVKSISGLLCKECAAWHRFHK